MRDVIRHSTGIALLALFVSVASGAGLAQSGSAGGSIGNDEKSLSGSREPPPTPEARARRSKPEAEDPRGASRRTAVVAVAATVSMARGS
jgi:hypothetical protein